MDRRYPSPRCRRGQSKHVAQLRIKLKVRSIRDQMLGPFSRNEREGAQSATRRGGAGRVIVCLSWKNIPAILPAPRESGYSAGAQPSLGDGGGPTGGRRIGPLWGQDTRLTAGGVRKPLRGNFELGPVFRRARTSDLGELGVSASRAVGMYPPRETAAPRKNG